jgi:quercetin dioxygenase-like cupin family protein/ketosteroid isomerase-like protein
MKLNRQRGRNGATQVDPVQEFRATMLARHIEAEEAFAHGDPQPRMALWSRRDPVTLFGAIGMSESGWNELSRTFPWVASRFADVSDFRIDVELVEVSAEMAYVLWFERFDGSIAGRPVEPTTVRVTHIYRREDGEWRIVHRHGDNPARDRSSTQSDMTEERSRPIVSTPGDGETLKAPVGSLSFTARNDQTGGALTAFQSIAAPGDGPPLHSHANEDEVIYVLEGRLRVRLEDAIHAAPAGSFVFFPRGVPHTWQNSDDEPVRLLVLFTPASPGMERFFDRAAEAPDGTPAADAFNRFAPGTGMEVLGPPLAISDSAS